jgi:hypothetical protein
VRDVASHRNHHVQSLQGMICTTENAKPTKTHGKATKQKQKKGFT